MLLAGDEWGNSQGGNNNAYCQDNPTGWLNWGDFDDELFAFTCRLAALRRAHPALRQDRYLHGEARPGDGLPDVQWFSFDGGEPDWRDAEPGTLALQVRTAAGPEAAGDDTVLIALNAAHADACLTLPPSPEGQAWIRAVDTAAPTLDAMPVDGDRGRVSGASGVVFVPGRPT
jgi:glycogen operon protein